LSDVASVLQSSDGSDLLAKLHDFPLVPDKNLPHTKELSQPIYGDEVRISDKDGLGISSLAIDPTSDKLLGSRSSEEEKDATSAVLHASQILRKYVFFAQRRWGVDQCLTSSPILGTQGWSWSILILRPAFTRSKSHIPVVIKTGYCSKFPPLLLQVSVTAAGELLCFLSAFEALTVDN
jgi:hypothetical protein